MRLSSILADGKTVHLNHNFAIAAVPHGIKGYNLFCGGNFVFHDSNLDEVLERYTRQITRNPNS